MRTPAILAALLLLAACPPGGELDIEDYDRACSEDGDCMIVSLAPCAVCGCAENAISKADQEAYQADFDAVWCPPRDPNVMCGVCPKAVPRCDDGLCEADLWGTGDAGVEDGG